MKIVLVHPSPKIWTRAALVPLGIAYIAAYLERNGFKDVEVIDYNVEPNAKLPRADIVGITATTPLIKSAWKIAKKAKKMGAITIIGGPHVSALPQESLNLPQVDFVAVGEGEDTMLEFCRMLESGKKNFEEIKGLMFKKGKRTFFNPRPFMSIEKLNSLPFPAHHLFKLSKYTSTQPLVSTRKPAVGIMTSRGCPFGCHFCFKGTFGRIWRNRDVESVLKEWEYLVRVLKVKEIAMMDDGFNINVDRAMKICKEVKRRGLVVPWRAHNGIRADLTTKKLLKAMKESGCYYVAFGVESGNQEFLNTLGKNLRLEKVVKAFKTARELGILTMAFFMVGNPGETRETIEDTMKFSIKLDTDFAQFSVVTPFPGTQIFMQVNKYGKNLEKDWDKYSQFDQRGYFDFGDLTGEDVARLAKSAYRRFYLRPKPILRLLRRKETWFNIKNVTAGAAHYLLQKNI